MSSTSDKKNIRIDEELVSVDALKHVICSVNVNSKVSIRRKYDDPPDFIVTINRKDYPVEVTSIVSSQQYYAHCKEFAEAIEEKANFLDILHGKYAFLVFRSPKIPKPNSKEGKKLIDAANAFIKSTINNDSRTEFILQDDEAGKIGITKFLGIGSTVELVWTAPAKWENDVKYELSVLIQNAVDTKIKKLKNRGVKKHHAMLLLYDAYEYGGVEDAAMAMKQVNNYAWFHSVFWAASFANRENLSYPEELGRKGHFLYSRNSQWNGMGTV